MSFKGLDGAEMRKGQSQSGGLAHNQAEREEVYYQCKICNFVLKQKRTDPPSYCPHCAVNHLKGEMVIMEEYSRKGEGADSC